MDEIKVKSSREQMRNLFLKVIKIYITFTEHLPEPENFLNNLQRITFPIFIDE